MKQISLLCFIVLIMSYDYQETLKGESLSRYKSKLDLVNCKQCPYKLAAGVWENNPCKWPDLQWGDVYSYLIDSPGVFTRESMKAYKSLDAHNFFSSGWVQTVLHYKPENSSNIIFKADVRPSQRVNDTPHHPWLALNKDGSVAVGHCDCMAGLSETCSHIAAVLFKIEAAVRLGYTKKNCTDVPCLWNSDFIKKVQPEPISNIKFYKSSAINKAKNRKSKKVVKTFPSADDAQQQELLQALNTCVSKPVALSTFHGYSDKFHWTKQPEPVRRLPLPLNNLYDQSCVDLPIDELHAKCKQIANSMDMSSDEIQYIYDCTKSQSKSLTWHEQRIGRISSSTIHNVMHTSIDNPSKSLLLKICKPSTTELNTLPIVWGRENETTALKAYQQVLAMDHQNLTVARTGFLIDKTFPFIGASSDSITTCDCHAKKVVEVKCPYKYRFSTYDEFLGDKDCFIHDKVRLNKNHQYYSQVQLQMYIHDTANCDFVVWATKFIVICNVNRDNTFISSMLDQASVFFMNCILPELLTRKIQLNHQTTTKGELVESEKVYCICQTPEDDKMIMCDNPTCKYKWFHLDCIKMKRPPKNDWYCRYCKKTC